MAVRYIHAPTKSNFLDFIQVLESKTFSREDNKMLIQVSKSMCAIIVSKQLNQPESKR